MRVAYVEMIGGASGDMLLGALVDAGADTAALERALRTIPVARPWTFACERVQRGGIAATQVRITVPGEDGATRGTGSASHAPVVRLRDVVDVLERSDLSALQKKRARAIYERLAQAEARVHGSDVATVHFHEVGATDAILDVAGFCVALDLLGIETLYASAFPCGRGLIVSAHGRYPNPGPATLELLRGFTTYDAGVDGEMVTPTAAAILSTLLQPGEARPAMQVEHIGYGAGSAQFAIPNVVRVCVGEPSSAAAPAETTSATVAVLEANLDDMSPQHFELALERIIAAGALDVWLVPIAMKKARPGIVLSALVPLEREAEAARAILRETTTLGVRARTQRRYVLERYIEAVATSLGTVRVKTALLDGAPRRSLEYDDVVRIARETGRTIGDVAHALGKEVDP